MNHFTSLLDSEPLINESLDSIDESSDIVEFVEYYTFELNEDEAELFCDYIDGTSLLTTTCIATMGEDIEEITVGTLKYTFAYNRFLEMFIGVDDINSCGIPYLLEAQTDISSALILLSKQYYKQTNQMLRSALESASL